MFLNQLKNTIKYFLVFFNLYIYKMKKYSEKEFDEKVEKAVD